MWMVEEREPIEKREVFTYFMFRFFIRFIRIGFDVVSHYKIQYKYVWFTNKNGTYQFYWFLSFSFFLSCDSFCAWLIFYFPVQILVRFSFSFLPWFLSRIRSHRCVVYVIGGYMKATWITIFPSFLVCIKNSILFAFKYECAKVSHRFCSKFLLISFSTVIVFRLQIQLFIFWICDLLLLCGWSNGHDFRFADKTFESCPHVDITVSFFLFIYCCFRFFSYFV